MVFRNLIDNAIKYGGAEPVVEIESHFANDSTIVTRVSDNGRGIPAAQRRKIFGRFVRLGRELERSEAGTGLGLFIVRTLVTRLHGKIAVRDRGKQQSGTVFEVQLPARPVAKIDDAPREQPAENPQDAVHRSGTAAP